MPTTLRAHAGATARLERATTARTFLLHLERELATALAEPLLVATDPAPRLEFTGGSEPGQRVAYSIADGAIVRRTAPRFAVRPSLAPGVAVLDDVAGLELRVFDGRDWVADWHGRTPPEAVRVRIVFTDGETAETVALIPTARRRSPS